MKKSRPALKALFIITAIIVLGCQPRDKAADDGGPKPGREKMGIPRVQVLCSFLPIWVFTKNVAGDRPGVDVELFIPGNQGPHDYALTTADMMKISEADLFIVNGFGLEQFLLDVIKRSRPEMNIVVAAEGVTPIYADEAGYWMASPEPGDREDEGSPEELSHHHDETGINPHTFVSPRQAAIMARRIGEAMAALDPAGAEEYRKNAREYAERLDHLADQFQAAAKKADNNKIVTFHNAFDYLARDSGLKIAGVIETVPGQQPSAGELAALADKIKGAKVAAIFSEPQYSDRLAVVLAEETGVKMDVLDPAASGEQNPGAYEAVMKKNLETLKRNLDVSGD